MTLVPDAYVLAPALISEFRSAILERFPDARIESDGHDLHVETTMVGPDAGMRAVDLVRHLRGGRPHNASRPADWHIRSLTAVRDVPSDPHLAPGHVPTVIGTAIAFSRSYKLPDGYDERTFAN